MSVIWKVRAIFNTMCRQTVNSLFFVSVLNTAHRSGPKLWEFPLLLANWSVSSKKPVPQYLRTNVKIAGALGKHCGRLPWVIEVENLWSINKPLSKEVKREIIKAWNMICFPLSILRVSNNLLTNIIVGARWDSFAVHVLLHRPTDLPGNLHFIFTLLNLACGISCCLLEACPLREMDPNLRRHYLPHHSILDIILPLRRQFFNSKPTIMASSGVPMLGPGSNCTKSHIRMRSFKDSLTKI